MVPLRLALPVLVAVVAVRGLQFLAISDNPVMVAYMAEAVAERQPTPEQALVVQVLRGQS
jgi:hypothetical protein